MILKINKAVKFVCAIVFLAVGVSCNTAQNEHHEGEVFRYNEAANISTLDPAFAKDLRTIWATNQLFNGLVQLDAQLEVQPDIAQSWELSNEGMTYTFYLRSDVKFHEHTLFGAGKTRKVVASDFVYSFQRLLDPKVASPGKWVLDYVDNFNAENDTTLVIHLKQAFPPFLRLMSMKYCAVVPKEAIDYFKDDFRSNPIGTGPFYFKLWVENTKLIFRKNKNYHERDVQGNQLPYVEAVAISFLPDKQTEFLQFIQGNLDFLNSIDASYKDDLLTLEGKLTERYASQINMVSGPYLNTEYLGVYLDAAVPEIQSVKIRKALNYGFDKEKMILYLRNGIGFPAVNGFIPKGMPSFNEMKGYDYQPEKAKRLIDAYVEATGDKEPSVTISTNSQYLDLCEYIQREMGKVGLKVRIDVMPPSTLRQTKVTGKLSIFRGSWVADYPDAENYLFIFHSKNFSPNGPNYTHYSNAKFDQMFEKAVRTVDKIERQLLYQKMDSLVMSTAPVIPLYYDEVVRFTQKNISGLGINPINHLDLKRVKKRQ